MAAASASRLAVPPRSRSMSSLIEVDSASSEHQKEQYGSLIEILENLSKHQSSVDDLSSLTSSVIDYEYENGRRYHAYKAGHYPLPNDENELDRLDLQHHVVKLLLDGELHFAPLHDPGHILDIGTGTGLWAIEMADRFPGAQIIGTDLSPVQPTWVPDNVSFEIDDLENEWLFPKNQFDLIHSRFMICSISDWRGMIANAYKHCKPGGFIELQELDPRLRSDDGTHMACNHHQEYIKLMLQASEDYGRPIPAQKDLKPWVEDAGFVDVKEYTFKVPINSWPKDRKLKEVGKYQCMNYTEGMEGISIGLFTRVLKWQPMEVSVFLARIRKELASREYHVYQTFTIVVGRKPDPKERSTGRKPSTLSEPVSISQNTPPSAINEKTEVRPVISPSMTRMPQQLLPVQSLVAAATRESS